LEILLEKSLQCLIYLVAVASLFALPFNAKRPINFPTASYLVESGDFNNDGMPDLAVGRMPENQSLGTVGILLGKGNGNFQPEIQNFVGADGDISPYITDLKVADLNDDNKLDIVVSLSASFSIPLRSTLCATILFGNGDGTFPNRQPLLCNLQSFNSVKTNSLSIGDFNNDGKKDIYIAGFLGGYGGIYPVKNLGNSQFTVTAPITLVEVIEDFDIGDFNQDGKIDVVCATGRGTFILYGAGNLYFSSGENRDNTRFQEKVTVADFNADGRDDYAVTDTGRFELRIFLNSSNGIPNLPYKVYKIKRLNDLSIGKGLINADFDGDNIPDIAVSFYRLGKVRIYYGSGTGSFFERDEVLSGQLPYGLTAADLDSNGKNDLIVGDLGSENTDKVSIFLNTPNPSRYYSDFDGDRKSDFTIFRPSTSTWWTLFNRDYSYQNQQFGLASDIIVAGNYDGDNKTDIAVFRNGTWYIRQSSNGLMRTEYWGQNGDIPIPADYDNDGLMETAVYRPSNGIWHIRNANGQVWGYKWGVSTDKPVPADYDGDGKVDIAVYRPSNGYWYILQSSNNQVLELKFGLADDKPVPSDYDGDGKSDIAVYRLSNGYWYIVQSSDYSIRYEHFGINEDMAIPNDYTGDGKSDLVVFRQSIGEWFIKKSENNSLFSLRWGQNQDLPN
jgi:hypothetical protein